MGVMVLVVRSRFELEPESVDRMMLEALRLTGVEYVASEAGAVLGSPVAFQGRVSLCLVVWVGEGGGKLD